MIQPKVTKKSIFDDMDEGLQYFILLILCGGISMFLVFNLILGI